jgi:leucyl/phenylalanyl-tRNA--protein transferase
LPNAIPDSWFFGDAMNTTSQTTIVAPPFHDVSAQHTSKESLSDRALRWALGMAWSLKPPRTWGVPATLWMVATHYAGLRKIEEGVPDPETALSYPDGLVGICHDIGVESLMAGYKAGLYPFSHVGPHKWWAPSMRMVLRLQDFHMEKNLRRRLRNNHFNVTFDQAFKDVVQGCGEPRLGRPKLTWVTPDVVDAYVALHEAGHAHSVEVWDAHGNLAGGAYGVAVGQVFITESQFTRKRDASKVGFATLNCHLQKWGFVLNDGKRHTNHLAQAGFQLMPRSQFNGLLTRHASIAGKKGVWAVDDALDVGNWDPKAGAQ